MTSQELVFFGSNLIGTKLNVPRQNNVLLPRTRLVERIEEGIKEGRILTLLSAPPGSGKTTLVTDWVRCSEGKHKVAWLSLEEEDKSLTRFLTYFIASVKTVFPGFGNGLDLFLQTPGEGIVERVLARLVEELNELPEDIVVVLDDFHTVDSVPVQQAVSFLLDHMPLHLHLVITTRADPHLSLAKLRARRLLTELRGVDLRFSPAEVRDLFYKVLGIPLDQADLEKLERRTEGWITGLLLAALALQNGREEQGSKIIQSLDGSQRFFLDYLIEEVLNRQPEEVQRFLLCTSVLERFTADLCEELYHPQEEGEITASELLSRIKKANLFLVPLDENDEWFRYHHLFAGLLRGQLNRVYPGSTGELHRRAALWFEEKGMLADAFHHALACQDFDWAARVMERAGWSLLLQGELITLYEWLERVPGGTWKGHPWLYTYRAWYWLLTGNMSRVGEEVAAVRACLQALSFEEIGRIEVHLLTIEAYRSLYSGDFREAFVLSSATLDKAGSQEDGVRAVAFFVKGVVGYSAQDYPSCLEAMLEAARVGRKSGNIHIAVPALATASSVLNLTGRLTQAEDCLKEALGLAAPGGKPSPLASRVYSALSHLQYEKGNLEESLRLARDGSSLADLWGNLDTRLHTMISQARALSALGRGEEAWEVLRRIETLFHQRGEPVPGVESGLVEIKVRLLLRENKNEGALELLESAGLRAFPPFHPNREEEYAALALVLLDRRERGGDDIESMGLVRSLLDEMETQAENTGRVLHRIRFLSLKARLALARKERLQAFNDLKEALHLAEREGIVRSILDAGEPVKRLLAEYPLNYPYGTYARKLVEGGGLENTPTPVTPDQSRLIEPLSERELEVLQLIADGLNNPEIAEKLVVALGTVKAHTGSIYAKLGVRSRTEALIRARRFGLIS